MEKGRRPSPAFFSGLVKGRLKHSRFIAAVFTIHAIIETAKKSVFDGFLFFEWRSLIVKQEKKAGLYT